MAKYSLVYKTNNGNYTEIDWKQIPVYQHSSLDKYSLKDIDKFTTDLFQNEEQLKSFLVSHGDEIGLKIANKRDELWNIANSLLNRAVRESDIQNTITLRSDLNNVADRIGVNNYLKNELKIAFDFYNGHDREEKLNDIFIRFIISELSSSSANMSDVNVIIDYIKERGLDTDDIARLVYYVAGFRKIYELETFPLHIIQIEKKPNSQKYKKVELKEGIAYSADKAFLDEAMIRRILYDAVGKEDHKLIQAIVDRYISQNHAKENMWALREYARLIRKDSYREINIPNNAMQDFIHKEVTYKGYNKNYPGTRRLGMTISRHLRGNKQLDDLNHKEQFEKRVQEIQEKSKDLGYTKQLNFIDLM